MRLNTTKSMKLARRVKGRYGTWEAVRNASRREDGIFVIDPNEKGSDRSRQDAHRPLTA